MIAALHVRPSPTRTAGVRYPMRAGGIAALPPHTGSVRSATVPRGRSLKARRWTATQSKALQVRKRTFYISEGYIRQDYHYAPDRHGPRPPAQPSRAGTDHCVADACRCPALL
jgi:hypothetical protein